MWSVGTTFGKKNEPMRTNTTHFLSQAAAAIAAAAAVSCSQNYNIRGTSNISNLDGRMLYLRTFAGDGMGRVDSCDILHGRFSFSGELDSARMASISTDEHDLLPVVLEGGDISVRIDDVAQTVGGTPLNDKLAAFFEVYNRLKNEQAELSHKQARAIMDGLDMDRVNRDLNAEAFALMEREDSLITYFVTENFDNVLGAGVFLLVTSGMPYPELTPWVEDIMSKATSAFKADPYVKLFYEKAKENEQILNGMKDMPAGTAGAEAAPAITPEEMARPAE